MERRRGWLTRDGWWWQEGHADELLKFTEEAEKRFYKNDNSELKLQDVVQYVTHVQRSHSHRLGLIFDAMDLSKPSQVQYIFFAMQEPEDGYYHPSVHKVKINSDFRSLARAIEGGCLRNLKFLELSGGRGHSVLAKAIASGGLSSLRILSLGDVRLTTDEDEEYRIALRSEKVPRLSCLEIHWKALRIVTQSGKWENLDELKVNYTNLRGERYEKGLLPLAGALKSGRLDSLKVLDLQGASNPSETLATALVSAFSGNDCLTVDVKYEWYKFPELDRRRKQLIERNIRRRNILAGLVTVAKVQATIGKVYICGNPEVGKTTLRRTLQRGYWKSLITWERKPHAEKRTRGIDVSQLSSKGNKPDDNPITLQVWDMAGQEDFHVVHNAFFPDLGFAEGKATTFIVVCNSRNGLRNSVEQLEYWLRYIASSCHKSIDNPRRVFVVMNNSGRGQKIHRHSEQWKLMLEEQRDKFRGLLEIQTDFFLVDVRKFRQVYRLRSCLLEHSRDLLRNLEIPNICQAIEKSLIVLSQQMEQFPVLHWTEFVEHVWDKLQESWPDHVIEAATKYLNEAGVLIYINTTAVRLVVVDPNWFCSEIIGKVFLPTEMASPRELLFREKVDQTTGSISISRFKNFFKSLESEWSDTQVDDMIDILLWLGLCHKGKYENVFIPALIAEKGMPADPWCLQTQVEVGDHWVMGFSIRHKKSEVALAPISLWHRFQVDLAQSLKFDSEVPDNDFVANKYFMTFVKDYMNVLIEVDANLEKPTFEEISILVKPKFEREELGATERKQCQVDLADDIVERLLKLWNQVCPGVEYEHKVIWPWPTSGSRPKDRPEQNVEVAKVKQWLHERGVGRKMHWMVGSSDPITEDQLLPTEYKRDLGMVPTKNSGIEGHARQVNDSVFELYKPDNTPKVQIVFFHGLQMEDYSDAHLSAWQSGDGSTIWPQTWLVENISGAHVLSISYNEGLKYRSDGSLDMYLTAENLLSDLLQQDDIWPGVGQVPHCPVILVGHSIGGIVIKELCCLAHNRISRSRGFERAKLEKFLKSIGGIFYYATPHLGSEIAEILAKKIWSPLLTYFETLSKDNARLNSEFEAICKVNYKDWLFAGLGESLPTNLGPLKPGVAPKRWFVVPEASARVENFNIVEYSDHFSVCRPKSKTTRSFYKLRDFVSHIASKGTQFYFAGYILLHPFPYHVVTRVMLFLLKVKRAKHALDKACRWTWKKGGDAAVHKSRLLLQQKLMHFVNTLHQYVMDRVLYSAWVDLGESMSSARSLDEVIACHDAYLVSIQRQCLVAPDKLWTLIAGRVKTILGLALNYYSIQRVLFDGVGAPAITARCQLEIERVENQFDECMVFLMRVLSFKLNVRHFSHLADLVTRINYNFYYMTEDGQLSSPLADSLGSPKKSSRRL